MICLDLKSILRQHVGDFITGHVLKAVDLCSNIYVRGVYTSDILYNYKNLPREMTLKLARDEKWENLYSWTSFPAETISEESKTDLKKTTKSKKSRINNAEMKAEEDMRDFHPNMIRNFNDLDLDEPQSKSENAKKSQINSSSQRTLAVEQQILPDPIMSLKQIIGYSGGKPSNIKWTRPNSDFSQYPSSFIAGSNKYIIYSSGCSLVLLNPITNAQELLFGHTSTVVCLALSKDGSIIASGQEGSNPLVLI